MNKKRLVIATTVLLLIIIVARFVPVDSYRQSPPEGQPTCDIGVITARQSIIGGDSLDDERTQEYDGCAEIDYYLYLW